jgi:hypothetical protein
MARALDLLVVQSEIVNTAGAAIKNYEKFDLEATTAALFAYMILIHDMQINWCVQK